MKKASRPQRRSQDAASRPLPLLLLLFAASGCAALIYEIVWFQLLQLVIGSSSISLGVLLGVFMGGMCLGSWLVPRLLTSARHPLRVPAFILGEIDSEAPALGAAMLPFYAAYAPNPAVLLKTAPA